MPPDKVEEMIISFKYWYEGHPYEKPDRQKIMNYLRKELPTTITQHHQDLMSEVVKRADMEIYALENTLEKSKELRVAIGHKRVYERLKLIGEYQGRLVAWREIKEMLTEAQTIIKSK